MADFPRTILELANVASGYGNRAVLAGVSLTANKGELIVIEGTTGAGKTTLIRTLLGAQPLHSGFGKVLDTDLVRASLSEREKLRRRVGVVFQIPQFLPQESVLANVSVPLAIRGDSAKRCRVEGTRALVDAGLTGFAHKRPSQLSGGEQARLQIARALIHRPFLVLADEPFAHLDPDSTIAAESLLAAAHERGTTVIITTHRPTSLVEHARRLRLEGGVLV